MSLVRPGVRLVFASVFRLQRALRHDDFPAFDLPMKAISAPVSSGRSEIEGALITK